MHPRIQHLILHPFEVQLSDVALLQDEIEKYPYFSTLRTLLLFGLKEFDHASYQNELKKTSIYCPSRVALYHYLQKEKQESTQIQEEAIEIVETQEEIGKEIPTESIVALENIEENTEELTEDFIPSDEVEINSEEILVSETEVATEPVEEPKSSELTFAEWLSLPKKEVGKSSENLTTQKAPSEKEIKFQLIEEFIEKSPKITPPSKEVSISSVLEKSMNTEEYSDLMTETLAQIYTEQKKYDKAIRAYKILMIKYPEKEEYFSDKIEHIDYMMNSK